MANSYTKIHHNTTQIRHITWLHLGRTKPDNAEISVTLIKWERGKLRLGPARASLPLSRFRARLARRQILGQFQCWRHSLWILPAVTGGPDATRRGTSCSLGIDRRRRYP